MFNKTLLIKSAMSLNITGWKFKSVSVYEEFVVKLGSFKCLQIGACSASVDWRMLELKESCALAYWRCCDRQVMNFPFR